MKRKRTGRSTRARKRRGVRKFRIRRGGRTDGRQGMRPMAFKRTVWQELVLPNTTTTVGFWKYYSGSLAALPDVAEYTALFDAYKVNGIKYKFVPKFTGFDGSDATTLGTTNRGTCAMSVINDPRNVVTPTGTYGSGTYNSFLQLGNVRQHSGTRAVSVYFKPYIDDPMSVGTKKIPCPWLTTTNTNQTLNGFHVFFHDTNFAGVFNQAWDVYVTYYFQVRGMR